MSATDPSKPEKPFDPMKTVEMLRWIEKGRTTAVPDGNGNTLTLIELLAQRVFNDLVMRAAAADVSLTGLSLVALSSIRKVGIDTTNPTSLSANYGVPKPS